MFFSFLLLTQLKHPLRFRLLPLSLFDFSFLFVFFLPQLQRLLGFCPNSHILYLFFCFTLKSLRILSFFPPYLLSQPD